MAPRIRVRYQIDVDLDMASVNLMLNGATGDVANFIYRLGTRVKSDAQLQAPLKTGALRRSIFLERAAGGIPNAVEITANIEYALVVHEGRGPITIRPKPPRKVLKFKKGGEFLYRPKVEQDEREGNPFLWDALRSQVVALT